MISITKQQLHEIISSAYESGWKGCLEFKQEYADQVAVRFEEMSVNTVTVSVTSDISMLGYYSYFGQTSPMETMWVNNTDEDSL